MSAAKVPARPPPASCSRPAGSAPSPSIPLPSRSRSLQSSSVLARHARACSQPLTRPSRTQALLVAVCVLGIVTVRGVQGKFLRLPYHTAGLPSGLGPLPPSGGIDANWYTPNPEIKNTLNPDPEP